MVKSDSRAWRVFVGPIEIAGVVAGLESGLRSIGITADGFDISGDPLKYRSTARPQLTTAVGQRVWRLGSRLRRLRRAALRVILFARVVLSYDAFVIVGTGFWDGRELAVLRWLGKPTTWVFLGSDHRPPYLSGKYLGRGMDTTTLRKETTRVARRVERVERRADRVVAHEASAQFHRRPFIRLSKVGLPLQVSDQFMTRVPSVASRDTTTGATVRVLHCPTDQIAKGSTSLRNMVEQLTAEGIGLEFRELTGRPHTEVLAAIEASDLVLDELYSDTPMGILAGEAAWLGKPTVSGGYFAANERRVPDDELVPPAVYVRPDKVLDELRAIALDAERRVRLGEAAREFARTRWDPSAVAERLLLVLRGEDPPEWTTDPTSIMYPHGYGLSIESRVAGVRAFVMSEGASALCLPHRPDLVAAVQTG